MTEEQIENNKLIAEFIGRKGTVRKDLYTFIGLGNIQNTDIWYLLEDAKFHLSWDWLIPVIKKIREIKGDGFLWDIKGFPIRNSLLMLEIDDCYKHIVDYINDFNASKPISKG